MINAHRSHAATTLPACPNTATPLFIADWNDPVFIHFEIDPRILQPRIPFQIDTHEGRAYISLVAFTQARLRPRVGGACTAWLMTPLAQHAFLNLRTYVRVEGQPGIFFIAEWIPNRLAVLVGPRTYGLPYRLGRLRYRHDRRRRELLGRVSAPGGALHYRARYLDDFRPARPGSLEHFLLERYVAFTFHRGTSRRFDVAHAPWLQQRLELALIERSILRAAGAWQEHARFIGAHYSPGATDVSISAPRRLRVRESDECFQTSLSRFTEPSPSSRAR